MKQINSKDNKLYKICKQLSAKKYRDKLEKYLIEGPNLIEDAFKCNEEIDCIIIRDDYDLNKELSFVNGFSNLISMDSRLFDEIADTATSQGVLAIVNKRLTEDKSFFDGVGEGNVVVLDRLQDPGNIGTIIRTADAAGYKGVVAIKGCGDMYSPKTIRAAAGSVFRVPVLFVDTPQQTVRLLKENGKKIFATCFEDAKWYVQEDMSENVALVIGNEGNGICETFIEVADSKIKIPMSGNIDSLNAAVAAGILMYESVRKKYSI